MAQTIAAQYLPANADALAMINHALDVLYAGTTATFDTDINANSGATGGVKGLIAKINARSAVPGFNVPLINQIANAIQAAKDIGTLTDSNVNGVTTYVGLVALFTTQDPNLQAGSRNSFNFPA